MRILLLTLLASILYVNSALSNTLQWHALESAYSYVGVVEATGNNDGKYVEEILGYIGLPKGNPYCMATVVYCYHLSAKKLNVKDPLPRIGRVSYVWNYANSNPFKYKIITKNALVLKTLELEPGDISIHSRAGGSASNFNGHTGIVTFQIPKLFFYAIEGNTGGGKDQGEGQGIFLKKRSISVNNGNLGLKGFIRIK
jgi:hypothetical protein